MKSNILDLGDVGARPSLDAAMRGYIGLSRVRAAHNLLVAQPFSPLLFSQGPQPFPSALMEVLRGNVLCAEASAKMKEAHDIKKNIKLLKKLTKIGNHSFQSTGIAILNKLKDMSIYTEARSKKHFLLKYKELLVAKY